MNRKNSPPAANNPLLAIPSHSKTGPISFRAADK